MKLEDIGFYTLSDKRAKEASKSSPLQRCEILITDRCNFKCTYCRGVMSLIKGESYQEDIKNTINLWLDEGLQNIRFTGGEPTLYNHQDLLSFINICKAGQVKHIAISTNGTASQSFYETLIEHGVNDFSVSLDGGCCSIGDMMSGGITGAWNRVVDNIKFLASKTYVSVGIVFTEQNINETIETILFADSLEVKDIRVIPAAQYSQALYNLSKLPNEIINKYPILKYRINNFSQGIHVRGLQESDYYKCPLVLDDMAVALNYHFPCVIYMREQGNPIGKVSKNMRKERQEWFEKHNTFLDPICKNNCLDVCRDYNNKWGEFHPQQIIF